MVRAAWDECRVFSKNLLELLEARAALVTLLQIVQSAAGYVRDLWPVVWHSGIMRDGATACEHGADDHHR